MVACRLGARLDPLQLWGGGALTPYVWLKPAPLPAPPFPALRRGGLNLGALLLSLMVAMATVWWGQAQGDLLAGGARARTLRSTEVD